SPKLSPENFRAPFTVAEGWGTYRQQRDESSFKAQLNLKHGKLTLKKFFADLDKKQKANNVEVMIGKKVIEKSFRQIGTSCEISFNDAEIINCDESLTIKIN
ncbi:MAG TPA: hypothetical protein VLM16_03815, partial [Ginsengibacter sp.]|nr:hypothetical protein [Ginsengibacter sp.]